jgi:hypothetical protein
MRMHWNALLGGSFRNISTFQERPLPPQACKIDSCFEAPFFES